MTAPLKTPELPADVAGQSLRAVTGYAAFEPRKSWVLVGPNNRVIHLADNRKMLDALLRKGDRIARAVISPLTEELLTSHLETDGGCRINEEGTLHGQRHTAPDERPGANTKDSKHD